MKRALWLLGFTLVLSGVSLGAQGEVEIVHDPIQCWPVDQFLMLRSSFVPPGDIQTAKFYFRATDEPDYYYIEFTLGPEARAIAPKADPTTMSVTYYIELVTRSYNSFRLEERVVPVASGTECQRRDPGTAFYNGQNPDIAVGATRVGTAPLPPGFQAEGISKFMNATGIVGGPGGGISGKTIGIIAGLGAGAGGALALTGGGGSETTTTSPFGGTTSSVASTSTSTAVGGGSSSTTTVGGGSSTSSTTTTVGGGGSTTTIIGSSTTTIIGSSTTTSVGTSSSTTSIGTSTTTAGSSTTTSVGTSTTTSITTSSTTTSIASSTTTSSASSTTTAGSSTTTAASSSTTTASTSTTSRPTTTAPGAPDISLTKSDSPDPVVVGQSLTYTISVTNNGPGTANTVNVTDTHPASLVFLGSDLGCTPASPTQVFCNLGAMQSGATQTKRIRFRPTASGTISNTASAFSAGDPDLTNNIDTTSTRVTTNLKDGSGEVELTYRTALKVEPPAGSGGHIVWNGSQSQETAGSGEFVYVAKAIEGENRIAAHWTATGNASGSWRFDFGAASQFVSGSIRVESGHVLFQDGSSVVFELRSGGPSPRFTIQVGQDPPSRLFR